MRNHASAGGQLAQRSELSNAKRVACVGGLSKNTSSPADSHAVEMNSAPAVTAGRNPADAIARPRGEKLLRFLVLLEL